MNHSIEHTRRARRGSARSQRRRRRQAMTLVEIMIVMVIMALVTAAASFAILPRLKEARIKSTQGDAKKIASAAEMYLAENTSECPTVDKLVEAKILSSKSRTKDAWDHEYTIECDEDGAIVRSGGPDGQMGTDDDIE